MDVSNSLIATGIKLPVQTPKSQDQAQSRLPQVLPATNDKATNSARAETSFSVNSAELVRKAEALQSTRLQRDNTLEDAPFKGQQAINAYQQTLDAARQYDEGELVGIDLYV
jgi:hypothetical protein